MDFFLMWGGNSGQCGTMWNRARTTATTMISTMRIVTVDRRHWKTQRGRRRLEAHSASVPAGVETVPPPTPGLAASSVCKNSAPGGVWSCFLSRGVFLHVAQDAGTEVFLEPLAGAPFHVLHFLGTRETLGGDLQVSKGSVH